MGSAWGKLWALWNRLCPGKICKHLFRAKIAGGHCVYYPSNTVCVMHLDQLPANKTYLMDYKWKYTHDNSIYWKWLFRFWVVNNSFYCSSAKTESNSTSTADETLYPRPRLPPISFPNASAFTVYSSTQNLPAVLNDPRLLKRQTDFFTKTWGEDFIPQEAPPLTLLPKIPTIYFDDYLKKTEFVSNPFQIMVYWENMYHLTEDQWKFQWVMGSQIRPEPFCNLGSL